jgi:tetratricopeptide (TPR) repeat protein/transglutaminase-like putative cysteine protease
VLVSVLVLSVGCATFKEVPLKNGPRPERAVSAAEDFYRAQNLDAMRDAVARAQQASPDGALYHELAAQLADLEDQPDERFTHLLRALADVADDAPYFHLMLLWREGFPLARQGELESLLHTLAYHHPNAGVRAAAAQWGATLAHERSDEAGRDALAAQVPGWLHFHVMGAWDNDQGRGFETVYSPERGVRLDAHEQGVLLPVSWRDVPTPWYGTLDLGQRLTPNHWALAYAASGVRVGATGPYELRLTSTDPVKVWVNGTLVFTAERVESHAFDQWVLPVTLRAGVNQVLIKTAHRDGSWRLGARITGPGGAPVALASVSPELPAAEGPSPGEAWEASALLNRALPELPPASARRAYLKQALAAWSFNEEVRTPLADVYAGLAPQSVLAQWELTLALWRKEKGRATDVLEALSTRVGERLPLILASEGRLWLQQGKREKARELLLSALARHPDAPSVREELASLFHDEGWLEDRCAQLDWLASAPRTTVGAALEQVQCQEALGHLSTAAKERRALEHQLPWSLSVLNDELQSQLARRALEDAGATARTLVRAYPDSLAPYLSLAHVQQLRGHREEARGTLKSALLVNPDEFDAWSRLGHLAYETGDKAQAVEAWKRALASNPKDEALSHRLAYLSPVAPEPWRADVPSEAALDAFVASRTRLQAAPGAQLAYLDDEDVTTLKADGSSASVVTQVAQILTVPGRDRFTHVNLGGYGWVRILHAYAVGPGGERIDASSTEGNVVRFRRLEVGSTVVLQFEANRGPSAILSTAWEELWNAEELNVQYGFSRFVLWVPKETPVHELASGAFARTDEVRESQRRLSWTAKDVAPMTAEEGMPPVGEVNLHVHVSTVPGWDGFARYLKSLWEGVERGSPELDALAERLFHGVDSPEEKLNRIQEYIEGTFRYEMERPSIINNWQPFAAPVTLERKYGDCKDRTVLFATLAQKAGLKAEAALLMTRGAGMRITHELPSVWFNHAIVYFPPQVGLPKARFFDSTTEDQDVAAIRPDDPGTEAFVFDPKTGTFHWESIPFDAPELNAEKVHTSLTVAAEGSISGTQSYVGTGLWGQAFRHAARNPEAFAKGAQAMVAATVPGATASTPAKLETQSLRSPASFEVSLTSATAARFEDGRLRLRLPELKSYEHGYSLESRRYPLVEGVPQKLIWDSELALPKGMQVEHLPKAEQVEAPCFRFSRATRVEAGKVLAHTELVQRCAQISPKDYPLHRAKAQRVSQLLSEELVLKVQGKPRQTPLAKENP